MGEEPERYLRSCVEQGVLVLTITETKIQSDDIADALRQEMLAAVARSGIRKVVIDFRHAQYLSSTAFRPLLSLRRKLQEDGGQIILCGLSSVVGDIFYTTRMIDPSGSVKAVFDMQPDVASAIAFLNQAPDLSPSAEQE
jgi:anti-anti-sigma factor